MVKRSCVLTLSATGAIKMKLYWRIKLGGSWTWRPAVVVDEDPYWTSVLRYGVGEEEEE